MVRKDHCPWCGRDDVPITKKGGFDNHVNAAGRKCIGVGMVWFKSAHKSVLTPPKKIKGPYSKLPGRARM